MHTMNVFKTLFFLFFTIFFASSYAQEELVSLDSINLKGQKLLFEKYESFGMNCFNKNNLPSFCSKELRLFDNNIEDLIYQHEQALTYLYSAFEIIEKSQIDKAIYKDLESFRYLLTYQPTSSKKGNSCMSNPGSLLIEFYLYDRILDKKLKIDLNYSFFICDIQVLVNKINERLTNQELEKIQNAKN